MRTVSAIVAGVFVARTWFAMSVNTAALAAPLAQSRPRTHTIELDGALAPDAPRALTVDRLTRDFPRLTKFVIGLWQEEAPQTLEGVLLKDLVSRYAAPGITSVSIVATNEYTSTFLPADWQKNGALLAFKSNGVLIPTRMRGTFRVAFDYAAHPKLEADIFDMKWVWQVKKITFLTK